MTIRDLLASLSPRVDAEVLLAAALKKDRSWILSHEHDDLDAELARTCAEWIQRRTAGEPIAYITGQKEFYGRTFAVRPGVLIPRSCTESLVEGVLALLDGETIEPITTIDAGIVRAYGHTTSLDGSETIVDVGTGSGCIAVTIACERPNTRCIAIDISVDALEVAKENAERHGVLDRIDFRQGSVLEPLRGFTRPFLVVTNPPYVTDISSLADDVRMFEPADALMGGGTDGADILRAVVAQATALHDCRGIVAECLAMQAKCVTES